MTIAAENCYEILGISPEANDEEVKQAFRELAKNYHPDRNPGDEEAERQFKRVNMAYDAVKDAGRRQAYNEWLAFSVGRQKTKRRQWGRLAALLVLLLLGPSAAISWIAFSGEGSIVESGKGQPETAATSETPPMPPSASGDPAQQDPTGSATAADNPVGVQAGANQEPDKALPPKAGGRDGAGRFDASAAAQGGRQAQSRIPRKASRLSPRTRRRLRPAKRQMPLRKIANPSMRIRRRPLRTIRTRSRMRVTATQPHQWPISRPVARDVRFRITNLMALAPRPIVSPSSRNLGMRRRAGGPGRSRSRSFPTVADPAVRPAIAIPRGHLPIARVAR